MFKDMYINMSDIFKIVEEFENIYGKAELMFFDNAEQQIVIFNRRGEKVVPAKNIEWYADLYLILIGDVRQYSYLGLCYQKEVYPACACWYSNEKPDCTQIEIIK